jgi:hypothetical protein
LIHVLRSNLLETFETKKWLTAPLPRVPLESLGAPGVLFEIEIMAALEVDEEG